MRRPLARFTRALALAVVLVAPSARAQEPSPPLPAYVTPISAPPPPPSPITLDFGPQAGFAYRFSAGGGLPITGRFGAVIGATIAVSPSPLYAIGLGYEHSGLGSEHGAGAVADVEVTRALDVLWASVRLAFLRTDRVMLVAQVGPGLAFQHVEANVLVYQGAGLRPTGFTCGETGSPGLALRAALGLEARLNRSFWFTLESVLDSVQLSSDALGTCAPGAGSVSLVGLRAGFKYRLDVSRAVR